MKTNNTNMETYLKTCKEIPDGVYVLVKDVLINVEDPQLESMSLDESDLAAIVRGPYRLVVCAKTYGEADFDEAQKIASLRPGFRLPTRHEAIEIYDARFNGLDKAIEILGGDKMPGRWYWTCEAQVNPEYGSNYAFFYNGYNGSVNNDGKYGTYAVLPVSAF